MRKKDNKGRFTKITEEPLLEMTTVRIPSSDKQELKSFCSRGETMGDKIREAIALYIQVKRQSLAHEGTKPYA